MELLDSCYSSSNSKGHGPRYGVYAFFRNHEDYILSFLNCIKDADEIVLCDAGSIDGTPHLIENFINNNPAVNIRIIPIHVFPWRYDDVRNIGLALICRSTDLCLCLNIEENLVTEWKSILDRYYDPEVTRYQYYAQTEKVGTVQIMVEGRIHRTEGYFWKYPVFEELIFKESEKINLVPHVIIKQRERETDHEIVRLLRQYIKEHPSKWTPLWHLAQVFLDRGYYSEANHTLEKALQLDDSDKAEIYALKAQIFIKEGLPEKALFYYTMALIHKNDFRLYMEKAHILSGLGRHLEACSNLLKAKRLRSESQEQPPHIQSNESELDSLIALEKKLAMEEIDA